MSRSQRDVADELAAAAAWLREDFDLIVERSIARTLTTIDSYSEVPYADLVMSVSRNVRRASLTLAQGRVPVAGDLSEAAQTTAERVALGIPIEDILRGYRTSISVIFQRFNEIAAAQDLSGEAIARGSSLLWELGDSFIAHAAVSYQRRGVDFAVREARVRNEHVRAVLAGESVVTGHGQWTIDPNATYRAVVAVADQGNADEASVRVHLERTGGDASRSAVVGIVDGLFVGYVTRKPKGLPGVFVAVGGEGDAEHLPDSFSLAKRILQTADRSGIVLDLEQVGWKAAARSVPELTELVHERYVRPLRELGDFGAELEHTLRVYFAHDRHTEQAAAELVIHPNSLRYRLRKVSELLSLNLESTGTLIEFTLALEASHPQPLLPATMADPNF